MKDPVTGKLRLLPDEVLGSPAATGSAARTFSSAPGRPRLGTLAQEGELDLDRLLTGYPPEAASHLLRGVGSFLRSSLPRAGAAPPRLQAVLDEALRHPIHRERVAEGMGMSLTYPLRRTLPDQVLRTERALEVVPTDLRLAVRRGQGVDLVFERDSASRGSAFASMSSCRT